MFESITATNFQSWKDLHLKLSPGVNAIIGPSDSGKTAIFRAINWLVNNRPLGDEFRSWWGGDTVGGIRLQEGFLVERKKTDTENLYILTGPDGESENLPPNDKKVPAAVQKVLNLSEINFRFQHDTPFLLGQSAGANARYLNSVVNLDLIDKALYNINQRLRDENWKLTKAEEEKKQHQEKLKKYDWIPDADQQIKEAERIESEFRKAKSDYFTLEALYTNLEKVETELSSIIDVAKFEDEVNALLALDKEVDSLIDQEQDLIALLGNLNGLSSEIVKAGELLKYEDEVNDLIKLKDEIDQIKKEKAHLQFSLDDLADVEKLLAAIKLDELEEEFHKLMPDRCPLCGGKKNDR